VSRKTRLIDAQNKNKRRFAHEQRQAVGKLFAGVKKARGPRITLRSPASEPGAQLMERLRDQQEPERALDNLFPHRGRRRRRQKTL
jgi:hypothetical protein